MDRFICRIMASETGGVDKIKRGNNMLALKHCDVDYFHLFINEVAIMKMLRDSNIIEILEYNITDVCKLVMPYYKTHLGYYISLDVSTDILDYIFCEIFKGLSFIHSNNLVHGDIKPSNIMLNYTRDRTSTNKISNMQVKIIDFEICTSPYKGEVKYTEAYRPIEGFIENSYYKSSDMWAMGCLIYRCINNKSLFSKNNNEDEIFRLIPIRYENIYNRSSAHNYKISIKCEEEKYKLKFTRMIHDTLIINHKYRLNSIEILKKYYNYDITHGINYKPITNSYNKRREPIVKKLNILTNKFSAILNNSYDSYNSYDFRLNSLWKKYNRYVSIITVFDLIGDMELEDARNIYLTFNYICPSNIDNMINIIESINFNIHPITIIDVIMHYYNTDYGHIDYEQMYEIMIIVHTMINNYKLIHHHDTKKIIKCYNTLLENYNYHNSNVQG